MLEAVNDQHETVAPAVEEPRYQFVYTRKRETGEPDVELLQRNWHLIGPFCQRLGEEMWDQTFETVCENILSGRFDIWLVAKDKELRACLLGQLIPCDNGKKIYRIHANTGQFIEKWIEDAKPVLYDFARAQGVDRLDMLGRKGYLKALHDWQLDRKHVPIYKDVANV